MDGHLREKSHTLVVNAHGALIALSAGVELRQPLVLQNEVSGKKQSCFVIHVAVGEKEVFEVGVEFSEPAPHFWNIGFPPEDWKVPID
jgi:hypothetical protein